MTNVARASLQELLVDYEDYLRVRGLEQWTLQDPRTRQIQTFCNEHNASADYVNRIQNRTPETIANIAITLIHQEDVMLRKLIERLEKDFVEKGGIKEQMTAERLGFRQDQKEEIENLKQENNRLHQRINYLEDLLKSANINF